MITLTDAEYDGLKARIAALEAGLRRIKAGIEKYATDTVWIGEFETACDAIELLLGPTAETDCDHDLQHATHTMVVASYPDYQTATCRVCGARFSTDVGDSTANRGDES